jgi:uncharacterized protein (DUF924 family)
MTVQKDVTPQQVLRFWLDEIGPGGWFGSDADDAIRDRFLGAWQAAHDANAAPWTEGPEDTLASTILLDQFPRNLFRGDPRAFATDPLARALVRDAMARGHDMDTPPPQRVFYYMPLEHSEDMADQDEAVRLIEARMEGTDYVLHAHAHREIIRRFGRFPFRNEALGRRSTLEEAAFMEKGGYGALLREMKGGSA